MRSFFAIAFICLFLAAVCSAQSNEEYEGGAIREDSPCTTSIKETVKVLKDIVDLNRPVIESARQIGQKFVKCYQEQQNIQSCKELVKPDVQKLVEQFKSINKDTPQKIKDQVKDIIKNCRRQFFLEVIQTAFLA